MDQVTFLVNDIRLPYSHEKLPILPPLLQHANFPYGRLPLYKRTFPLPVSCPSGTLFSLLVSFLFDTHLQIIKGLQSIIVSPDPQALIFDIITTSQKKHALRQGAKNTDLSTGVAVNDTMKSMTRIRNPQRIF